MTNKCQNDAFLVSYSQIEGFYLRSLKGLFVDVATLEIYCKSIQTSFAGLEARLTMRIDDSIKQILGRQEQLFIKMEDVIARQNNEVEVFKKDAADLISEVKRSVKRFLTLKRTRGTT